MAYSVKIMVLLSIPSHATHGAANWGTCIRDDVAVAIHDGGRHNQHEEGDNIACTAERQCAFGG